MYIATPHALEGGVSRVGAYPLSETRKHVDVDYGPIWLKAPRARVQKEDCVYSIVLVCG